MAVGELVNTGDEAEPEGEADAGTLPIFGSLEPLSLPLDPSEPVSVTVSDVSPREPGPEAEPESEAVAVASLPPLDPVGDVPVVGRVDHEQVVPLAATSDAKEVQIGGTFDTPLDKGIQHER